MNLQTNAWLPVFLKLCNILYPEHKKHESETLKLVNLGFAALKIMCLNRGPYFEKCLAQGGLY